MIIGVQAMQHSTRRGFLTTSGAGVTGAALLTATTKARATFGANTVNVGLIGCGGRGSSVIQSFVSADNCRVGAVCDPDNDRAARLAGRLGKFQSGATPTVQDDLRRVLDDGSIDAVVIATPDHWHAPAAILACDAGKHVYVEKPCSHNLREGRLLVEAARRNKRVVQHGTQSRSHQLIVDAMQMLEEGIVGDVLVAKAWNVQRRGNIGHEQPSDPPPGLDYDVWVGPAEYVPFQKNRFHYSWHWWFNFGTGDMGNDGVHELDYARWGLGVNKHPTRVAGLGTKLYFDDDQQFPDTQTIAFEYPGDDTVGTRRMLIWEMRIWSRSYPHNIDNGCEYYGTEGRMLLTKRGKLEIIDNDRNRVEPMLKRDQRTVFSHQDDFLDAIRSGREPNAEIVIGHLSSSLCHLGNIATRLGRSLDFDPEREQITNDTDANRMLGREYRDGGHWGIPHGV